MTPMEKNYRPNVSSFPLFLSYLVFAPPLLPPLQELQLLPQALVPAQAAHAYQGRHEAATSSLNFPPKSIAGIAKMKIHSTVSPSFSLDAS